MKRFIKIITEKSDDGWAAWFEDAPEVSEQGAWAWMAIIHLLNHFGVDQFDAEGLITLDSRAKIDHLEFLIPLRNYRRLVSPSLN